MCACSSDFSDWQAVCHVIDLIPVNQFKAHISCAIHMNVMNSGGNNYSEKGAINLKNYKNDLTKMTSHLPKAVTGYNRPS